MRIRLSQLRLDLDDWQMPPEAVAARALRVKPRDILSARLVRRSVDARDKGDVHFILTLDAETARPVRLPRNAEELPPSPLRGDTSLKEGGYGGRGQEASSVPPSRRGVAEGRGELPNGCLAGEARRGGFAPPVPKAGDACPAGGATPPLHDVSVNTPAAANPDNPGAAATALGNPDFCDGRFPALESVAPGTDTRKAAATAPRRCLVVGMGPGGLFAALTLARAGFCPTVVERGKPVEQRAKDVAAFWNGGPFDPESNVQFGEGGAGTFSDGKLNSGIRDPRCRAVLETFCRAGAPESILWQAKPHVGTDHLKAVVRALREEIIALGGDVRFETLLTGLKIEDGAVTGAELKGPEGAYTLPADAVILAVGHSARETFEMLYREGASLSRKPFAIGARVEHLQSRIDRAQYGAAAGHPALGAADYKLAVHLNGGRSVFTFCMCPGGQVVAAASEAGGVVVNGMSLYARDGANANSALLVNVLPEDFGGEDPLAGVRFQQKWERAAFLAGGGDYRAPAQRVGDFLARKASRGPGEVAPSYRPGVAWGSLDPCLPEFVTGALREALPLLDRKLKGFAHPDAVLTGVETRSSSPVRVERGPDCQSNIRGLYPCGEGAGYAGGIMSAAVDGMRCAEAAMRL